MILPFARLLVNRYECICSHNILSICCSCYALMPSLQSSLTGLTFGQRFFLTASHVFHDTQTRLFNSCLFHDCHHERPLSSNLTREHCLRFLYKSSGTCFLTWTHISPSLHIVSFIVFQVLSLTPHSTIHILFNRTHESSPDDHSWARTYCQLSTLLCISTSSTPTQKAPDMNQSSNVKENIPLNKERYKAIEAEHDNKKYHTSHPHNNLNPPILSMASSSTTSPAEEAGNTIMSAHYLLSPLETLDESLNDSHEERIGLHDLTETYNLLATRIKEILLQSSEPDQAASPLTLLAERSHVLLSALRRDVKRVLINPRTTSPKERSQGMDLDEVHYARDLALLGQQAIRLTSELFAFPQLNATMHGMIHHSMH